jgi:hypothetical protein
METKKAKTTVVVSLLALAALCVFSLLAMAGNLEPNAPPAPTMKTLNEIYDAVTGVSQREGYINHIDMEPNSSTTLFTVPTGKKFVLLKMVLRDWQMYLTKNGSFLTGGAYTQKASENGMTFMDFPDRCVVLNAGDSLGIVNSEIQAVKAMVVGYFFDI